MSNQDRAEGTLDSRLMNLKGFFHRDSPEWRTIHEAAHTLAQPRDAAGGDDRLVRVGDLPAPLTHSQAWPQDYVNGWNDYANHVDQTRSAAPQAPGGETPEQLAARVQHRGHGCPACGRTYEPIIPPATPEGEAVSPNVRAALYFALWHHQGGSSVIGQPIRKMLGMGQHEHMSDEQVAAAKALVILPDPAESSGGDAVDAARDDEWVLVPRRITGPATEYLANFDMDEVGNNRGDAAYECWAALVDQLGRPAPELQFSNPVFHAGTNLTVRRGLKWYREEWATVQIGDTRLTVRLSCMTHKFAWLTDHWLRDEHDPACRTVAGLLAEMKRVYPGFSENEEVTLIRFNVPAIDAAIASGAEHGR